MTSCLNLADQLRHRADQYFTEMRGGRVQVVLRRTSRRRKSTLQEFIIRDSSHEHVVLVKTPSSANQPSGDQGQSNRWLASSSIILPELKSQFEFDAMSAIEHHLGRLNDPRFGAVHVLDLLPDRKALVMEKVSERSLSWLLTTSAVSPRREPRQTVDRVVQNAGHWLRRYHALPGLQHTRARATSRAEFIDSIEHFTEYLAQISGRSYFERLGCELIALSQRVLPSTLPLGLSHGDYAPRNVLAAASGRIHVIDTVARWTAPIYEDISQFLIAIKGSASQRWSCGLACRPQTIARLERQFLDGYFEDQTVPIGCIRLFECQALVERWAALAHRRQKLRGWKRAIKGARTAWWDVFFRSAMRQLLGEARMAASITDLSLKEVAE